MGYYYESSVTLDYSAESQQQAWDRQTYYYGQYVPPKAWVDPVWEIWQQATKKQITQATAGGWLQVSVHVVNDDGLAPFRCKIDQSAGGWAGGRNEWDGWLTVDDAGVLQEDPNDPRGRAFRAIGQPSDGNMVVKLPKDLNCVGETLGGQIKNLCLVRCENFAASGPFGGCIFFQQYKPPKTKPIKAQKPPKPKHRKAPQVTVTENYEDPTETNPAEQYPDGYQKRDIQADEEAPKLRFKRDD
ncbi:hypothetical protein H072_8136 [Dactylellina haptotyla CBS 200.50]|uniref:Uncharacterized protein n=1 Tax=Dactylellina haptotyla (strain CBS 200.50) TaxID=1284197 RepID=S8A523_DACHA|nr:hypothetical protein H072_8136 [Dactylellina haptotyla CBS 200.50]